MRKPILIMIFSLLFFSSCVTKKEYVYLQGNYQTSTNLVDYEPKIQKDDLLNISVFTKEEELASPFNLKYSNNASENIRGYLVDQNGDIEFPILGKIKVSGFSKTELKQIIKDKLALYISNPIVDVKLINFKVSVLGEVKNPGVIQLASDRVTLLEVIAQSGDLTNTGRRDNILIIRDFQGMKTFNRVDITKSSFMDSPFYYLDQNDVVYVEARNAKIQSSPIIGSNVTTIVSLASILLSSYIIFNRL